MSEDNQSVIPERYSHIPQDEEDSIIKINIDDGHGHKGHVGTSSIKTASSQIANTIMGAGILSIPVTMSYLGLVLGTIFIITISLITTYSVELLIRCKDITGR